MIISTLAAHLKHLRGFTKLNAWTHCRRAGDVRATSALSVTLCTRPLRSGLTLCNPWTVAQNSTEFSRREYWSGLPSLPPKDLPNPGVEPASPVSTVLQAGSLPPSHLESPSITLGLFFCLGCTSITWGIFKTLVPRLLPTSDLFPGISGFQSSLGGPTRSLQGEERPGHRPVSAEQLPVALGGGWALHSEPELTGHFKSGGLFLLFPSCPFSSC